VHLALGPRLILLRDWMIIKVNLLMKYIFIQLIKLYQDKLSPVLGKGKCLFSPTCSCYALEVLEKYNVLTSITLISFRLLSCNPINAYLKLKRKETYAGI